MFGFARRALAWRLAVVGCLIGFGLPGTSIQPVAGVGGCQVGSAQLGANLGVTSYPEPFQYATNRNQRQGWAEEGLAQISAQAGASTTRISLPGWLFADPGGYSLVDYQMTQYAAAGLTNLNAMLIAPPAAQSNAPPGENIDWYSPKNLYQPIWTSPGVVNPNNYWANHVKSMVSRYKNQVKVWAVWNEPDFTYAWDQIDAWFTAPPPPNQLNRWNDTIYSYVRALRVSYEVIKYYDPTAIVTLGGLGYDSFVDAVLRYSDNPVDGSVNATYPACGGAWFDAVDLHHYPQYATFDRVTNQWVNSPESDSMAASFAIRQNNIRLRLQQHGYGGSPYPAKMWVTTETGVSSKAIGQFPGGAEAQKNYLLKMPVIGQRDGIVQAHWYTVSDEEPDSAANDPFRHMGLYYDVASQAPGSVQLKPWARAYTTYSTFMRGKSYDHAATNALAPPSNVAAHVFRDSAQRKTYVVWAKTSGASENAAANWNLPTSVTLVRRQWDFSVTNATTTLNPTGGAIALSLTGTPIFLTESTPGPTPTNTPPGAPTATRTPTPTATPPGAPSATPTRTPTPPAGGSAYNLIQLISPVRVLDTRPGTTIGFNPDGTSRSAGPTPANQISRFRVSGLTFPSGGGSFAFPSDTTAIFANVTTQNEWGYGGGYVVLFPGDAGWAPNAATLVPSTFLSFNFWSASVAPLVGGVGGSVGIYASSTQTHVIVDVVGYTTASGVAGPTRDPGDKSPTVAGALNLISPARVLDTRAGTTTGFDGGSGAAITPSALTPNVARAFRVAGKSFNLSGGGQFTFPAQVSGVIANVTTIAGPNQFGGGFITLYPGGATLPNAATLNPVTPIAFNGAMIAIPDSGPAAGNFQVFSPNALDVVVDIVGYWSPQNPTTLTNLSVFSPVRAVDTRGNSGGPIGYQCGGAPVTAGPIGAGQTRCFEIANHWFIGGPQRQPNTWFPATAKGILANVTLLSDFGGVGGGFVTVFPGDGTTPPNAATLNPSTTIAENFTAVRLPTAPSANPGGLKVYSTNQANLVIDVMGYFE